MLDFAKLLLILKHCVFCARQQQLAPVGPSLREEKISILACDRCRSDIESLGRLEGLNRAVYMGAARFRLFSLYNYRERLRAFILRGKVQGDTMVPLVLAALVASHPVGLAQLVWADVIVPAPASLWSRLRGRQDISFAVAEELAQHFNILVLPAPMHLHWRLRKRAQQKRTRRRQLDRLISAPLVSSPLLRWHIWARARWARLYAAKRGGPKLLVLDDVLTTGFTLTQVAQELSAPGLQEIRLMAIADAR